MICYKKLPFQIINKHNKELVQTPVTAGPYGHNDLAKQFSKIKHQSVFALCFLKYSLKCLHKLKYLVET